MDVNYKLIISTDDKKRYLDILIGKIFKIIPIREEGSLDHLTIYLWALLSDLNSANYLFDGILIEVIVKLNSIYLKELPFKEMKKIVFDTIDVVQKTMKKLDEEDKEIIQKIQEIL